MFRRLCVWVLVASPTLAFAASKEIQELQRDVAQLQQQVRDLQRSQDEKFAALQVLVQQAVDNASKANTAVAVIQSGFSRIYGTRKPRSWRRWSAWLPAWTRFRTTCARCSRRYRT